MKFTLICGAVLAVALSASAASALPIAPAGGAQAAEGSGIIQIKSMPSRSIYHHGHSRHSGRGLRSTHRS